MLVKNRTNVANATMQLFGNATWKDIWKFTLAKNWQNATNVTLTRQLQCWPIIGQRRGQTRRHAHIHIPEIRQNLKKIELYRISSKVTTIIDMNVLKYLTKKKITKMVSSFQEIPTLKHTNHHGMKLSFAHKQWLTNQAGIWKTSNDDSTSSKNRHKPLFMVTTLGTLWVHLVTS